MQLPYHFPTHVLSGDGNGGGNSQSVLERWWQSQAVVVSPVHWDAEVEVIADDDTAEVGLGVGAAAGEAATSETSGTASTGA
jgi:hypothetical protein